MKKIDLPYFLSLGLVLFLSLFLFLYHITSTPPSLFSDEADANYQAFIFNHQFSDYYGNKFPVHFHSFSDWRTSLYIYSIAIVQKIIGHTDLAARLPASIFGTLTIFSLYLLIKNFTKSHQWGIIAAFLATITPWLFHYSRVGFEVTGMLFCLILGIYFWTKYIDTNQNKYLYYAIFTLPLTIYFYSTAKLFLALLYILMFIIWHQKIFATNLKTKLIVITITILSITPFLIDAFQGHAGYRFSYINIFSDPTVSKFVDNQRQEDSPLKFKNIIGIQPNLSSKIFHNKASVWIDMFLKNYINSFSSDFLFLKGDGNLRHGFQTSGYLLLPDILFLILGISLVFVKKANEHQKIILFMFLALIISPIPFSLTRDSVFPHGTRLIIMLPFIMFFVVLGIKHFINIVNCKILLPIIIATYILFFGKFIHQYYFHYPNISAREWHYGMKEAVLSSYNQKYDRIYYINTYEPFMPFFLNYSEYLPSNKSLSAAQSLVWDNNNYFTGMQAKNKFYLGNIEWSNLFNSSINPNYLYVIPGRELIKIQNSLSDFNKNSSLKIDFKIIHQTQKQFTEQEIFYLITFSQNHVQK